MGNLDPEKCTISTEEKYPKPFNGAPRKGKLALQVGLLFVLLYWYRGLFVAKPASSPIDWQPCFEDPSFLCGYLEVPTDYENPSAETSALALSKYPATCPESERLGIIITNFGGPGVPGRDASFLAGARIQNFTGNRHDIISFDQRGLGRSTPKVNCFHSALKYQMFKTNTVFETTFSVPKDPFSTPGRAVLIEQQKEALALEETQGAMCAETIGAEALGFMSTTTTIHDMEEISRILEGGDALINFVSNSYGSIVGAYLGNMLPHKAGKILIDGIVPGDMWANEHYESQALLRLLLTDSEKTYQLYLNECFKAGPEHCALSNAGDESPGDIKKRIDNFVEKLQLQPMRVTNYIRPGYLTSGGVRRTFFAALQMPEIWKVYSQMLASAINDADAASLMRMIAPRYSNPAPAPERDGYVETGQGELLRLAISCGDARPYVEGETWPTAGGIVDDILVTLESFPRFGATVHLMEQHGGCQFWPGTGVGPTRFTGPFNKTLATPTLIVSNTHDPITPYAAGKIVLETMGDSARLLLQGAAGHSYLAPTTACATKVIQRYFADGIIPADRETWCEREVDNYFTVDVEESSTNARLGVKMLGLD
ncbi:TAP-like protein-domain-containing protein [Mycena metata]|uniref:TAP-like protein-domain-containing protein n=1 Tax=Mycena metata TaxID=1033252 RepID=A0AAD7HXT9_9AGAR|nr:TAP-like protein-domain-containing protein [Mycena metata]